jgi:predicted dithiol-disulfide oxidoreductase (DUF899 family)
MHVFPGETADYRAARDDLLRQEIELRRQTEAVAAARRALPPGGVVPEDYEFDELADDGKVRTVRLSELFRPGTDALAVYNFMFPRHVHDDRPGPRDGATAELALAEGPCPSCSAFIDELDGAARHVDAHTNVVVAAKAPIERVMTFARERGWRHVRLVSSGRNSFAHDYGGEIDGQQMPILNVFQRDGDTIRHFWASEMLYAPTDEGEDPRHVGTLEVAWNLYDLLPRGRADYDEQHDYD